MINKYLFLFSILCLSSIMLSVNAQDALENFLQNADFENQGFAPWTMWVEDASAQALMAVDKKISFEGTQSLQIDIKKRGGGKRVELHQNPLFLKKGQKLTLAMWAKVTDDEIRPAKMIVNHRADPWTSYLFKEITIKWEWIEFWATFTMPADDNIVGVYIEMIDNAGQIWFDHFRLYEGNYIEENLGGQKKAIQPNEKMATTWSKVKLLD